jgi:heterodisulfide reductase subunit D
MTQGLLKQWHQRTHLCVKCKLCSVVDWQRTNSWMPLCPSAEWQDRNEAFFASGRVEIIRGFIEGSVKISEKLRNLAYQCTLCGGCATACAEHTKLGGTDESLVNLWEDFRAELVEQEGGPMPEHLSMAQSIDQHHNPYQEPHESRLKWLDGTGSHATKAVSVLYFAGCTSAYREPRIAKATVSALEKLGVPVTTLGGEEWCCGSTLLRVGLRREAQICAEHNAAAIKRSGCSIMITSCPGCYQTFKNDYPRLFNLTFPGIKIQHVTEFLAKKFPHGEFPRSKQLDRVVTFHDSCHLGRHMGIYDPPRKVLNAIPGITLVEMIRNKANAWCCGAGGGVKAAFKEFAQWTAAERVKDIESTNATEVVTTCPFCKLSLGESLKEMRKPIKVTDLMEVLNEAL